MRVELIGTKYISLYNAFVCVLCSAPRTRAVRAGQQLRGARRVGAAAVGPVPAHARAAAHRLLRGHALDMVTELLLFLFFA